MTGVGKRSTPIFQCISGGRLTRDDKNRRVIYKSKTILRKTKVGREMKIISFIKDAGFIRKILGRLNLKEVRIQPSAAMATLPNTSKPSQNPRG